MFSVVIPLYNKAPHIAATLHSVLAQTHQPDAIIVVDDGSTDGGAAIVEQFAHPLIKLIRQANAGVSAARNNGAASAMSPYLAFLDADDAWRPNHLETLRNLIERFPTAGLYSTMYEIHLGHTVFRPNAAYPYGFIGLIDDFFARMANGLSLVNSTTACVPANIFAQSGGFPVDLKRGEDLVLWMTLAQRHPVAHAAIITAVYNRDAVNRSVGLREQTAPGSLLYLRDLLAGRHGPVGTPQSARRLFRQIAFYTAAGMREGGDQTGVAAILQLAADMKMFALAFKITILSVVPRRLLSSARRLRHRVWHTPETNMRDPRAGHPSSINT